MCFRKGICYSFSARTISTNAHPTVRCERTAEPLSVKVLLWPAADPMALHFGEIILKDGKAQTNRLGHLSVVRRPPHARLVNILELIGKLVISRRIRENRLTIKPPPDNIKSSSRSNYAHVCVIKEFIKSKKVFGERKVRRHTGISFNCEKKSLRSENFRQ